MQVGAIIIGDELLSGKRQDKHMASLIRMLAARGMKLAWVEYVGDAPLRLRDALLDGSALFGLSHIPP